VKLVSQLVTQARCLEHAAEEKSPGFLQIDLCLAFIDRLPDMQVGMTVLTVMGRFDRLFPCFRIDKIRSSGHDQSSEGDLESRVG